jgi:hypothetical protein
MANRSVAPGVVDAEPAIHHSEGAQGSYGAHLRLFLSAEDGHLDHRVAPERLEEGIAVVRVPGGRGGHVKFRNPDMVQKTC